MSEPTKDEIARMVQLAISDIIRQHAVSVGDVAQQITSRMFDLADTGTTRPQAMVQAIRDVRKRYGLPEDAAE